ncbi:MAG: hypothetical protein GY811_03675, partial [Myxococcales bacterium]|nr:hypothetical protein [Myxococcales bacterium]
LEIISTRRRRSRLGYGSFAEVRFRDTGTGIPENKLRSLFIPFYTTKQDGTGLGLAISQRIVTQHNGLIEVRSTPGRGSTFSVFLPALGPSLPSEAGHAKASKPTPNTSITQPIEGFRSTQGQGQGAPGQDLDPPTPTPEQDPPGS